ncbi:MAG: hypothetical protein Q9217_001919, partial [Psora testacea]
MEYEPTFVGIAPEARTMIYHSLMTTTAARLPWRQAIRYAKFGFPVSVMVVNRLINREASEFIVSINTFNIVVGHRIVPDTVISPLPYGRYPTPPNFTWIERLHLTIEIDLDNLFASAHPDQFLPPRENESIFDRMQTLFGLIKTMTMPNLKSITLSIYEIIDPKKRIHVSCDINERDVRERYAEIIGPLYDLGLPGGLLLDDVDIVYGDGYTLDAADPEDWLRADDYIMLLKGVLYDFGCFEGPTAALGALLRNSIAPVEGRLTARQVFSEMTPVHPLEAPPVIPPRASDISPRNTPRSDEKSRRPSTLRRYWDEGTKFLAPPNKDPRGRRPPDSPQSSQSAPSASAENQRTSTKEQGKTKGRSSLGRYWEEGASYTLES